MLYQDASIVLHHGEHVGVTGANGVGKSTLLKMLQGELSFCYLWVNLYFLPKKAKFDGIG
ncbi:ATP-binding cassette domain-containing protein [Salinivibrio sp. IB643]|uniref:ATP-binding cassette domain-containing protein n=1 Tax=Salinivibrio sp. IB643 TaxID=1909445 RepID=UPI0009D34AA9|nr:hypothetical protein BZG77_03190 [Salinivibrio sp. IB643]